MKPPKIGQVVQRENRAWELSCMGLSLRKIAEQLHRENLCTVTHAAVAKMLHRVAQRHRADLTERMEEHKVVQLHKLELIYQESMRAWRASCRGARKITQKTNTPATAHADPTKEAGQSGGGTPSALRTGQLPSDYTQTVLEDQSGNPQHLKRALEALADIRKLLGLDAPTKVSGEIVAPTGAAAGVVLYLPHNGRDPLPGADPEPSDGGDASDGG